MKIRVVMMFAIAQVTLARVHARSGSADSRLSYPMQPEHADTKFVHQAVAHMCTHNCLSLEVCDACTNSDDEEVSSDEKGKSKH